METGHEQAKLLGHTGSVSSAAFSPDGSILATGNIVPDGEKTAADAEAGSVRLWNVATREPIATLPAHQIATWGLAFSPDGHTLATAGYTDNNMKLWDVKSRQLRAALAGSPAVMARIWSVAYSPDGSCLASGSASNSADAETLLVWDVAKEIPRHRVKAGWVWSVAFSPDGRLLATGSDAGLVTLWSVESGAAVLQTRGHSAAVRCVAFSRDGKIVASGSADKTIRLWDAATGDERATLRGHANSIVSLAFSPDGRTLASGDAGGAIRLWRAASVQEVVRLSSDSR